MTNSKSISEQLIEAAEAYRQAEFGGINAAKESLKQLSQQVEKEIKYLQELSEDKSDLDLERESLWRELLDQQYLLDNAIDKTVFHMAVSKREKLRKQLGLTDE